MTRRAGSGGVDWDGAAGVPRARLFTRYRDLERGYGLMIQTEYAASPSLLDARFFGALGQAFPDLLADVDRLAPLLDVAFEARSRRQGRARDVVDQLGVDVFV